jgi:hypothetical protein
MKRNRQCCCAATPPEDTGDEDFVLGAVESDDEDALKDGCWCWQSMAPKWPKSAKWVVPQWEVLVANTGGGGRGQRGQAQGLGRINSFRFFFFLPLSPAYRRAATSPMLLLSMHAVMATTQCTKGPCGPGNELCAGLPIPTYTFHLADKTCSINDPNFPFYDEVHGMYHHFYQVECF